MTGAPGAGECGPEGGLRPGLPGLRLHLSLGSGSCCPAGGGTASATWLAAAKGPPGTSCRPLAVSPRFVEHTGGTLKEGRPAASATGSTGAAGLLCGRCATFSSERLTPVVFLHVLAPASWGVQGGVPPLSLTPRERGRPLRPLLPAAVLSGQERGKSLASAPAAGGRALRAAGGALGSVPGLRPRPRLCPQETFVGSAATGLPEPWRAGAVTMRGWRHRCAARPWSPHGMGTWPKGDGRRRQLPSGPEMPGVFTSDSRHQLVPRRGVSSGSLALVVAASSPSWLVTCRRQAA